MALDDTIGSEAGSAIASRGAVLGAVRIGLVAITLVLIFDRLVPIDRQPAFLTGSQLRPLLSTAGQKGFSSLPPDVAATIDRLKQTTRQMKWARLATVRALKLQRRADMHFGAATATYHGRCDWLE